MEERHARRLQLDLELLFEVDFAELGLQVAAMLGAGASADSLAAASPFDVERIEHFRTLATWDWSRFAPEPTAAGTAERSESADYRCPACAHEWTGNPKPRKA